ncbi:MAG: GNAT family N-acetyltransferase [Flavobacteriaceae bacterium]|nr:GNAT family N-acetyltransferase [Flavobacteriaceae bacterium]
MSFTVRFAQKKDMTAVHQLITELAVYENEPDAVEISVEDLEKSGFSKSPKFQLLVAEEKETIIGMALFYERYSTWKGKAIHLEDLIVTQSKRKLGVGKALYSKLMQYAFENDYKRVAWEVLDWNKNAIDFYESTGAIILEGWQVVHMREQQIKEFIKK